MGVTTWQNFEPNCVNLKNEKKEREKKKKKKKAKLRITEDAIPSLKKNFPNHVCDLIPSVFGFFSTGASKSFKSKASSSTP